MNIIKLFLARFESIRDWFVPQAILDNAQDIDSIYSYRLVSGMLIITVAVAMAFLIYYPIVSDFDIYGSSVSMAICGGLAFFHAWLLLQLKDQPAHQSTARKLIFSVYLAILTGVIFTGGIFGSITPVFLPLPIVLAFLLNDRKAGKHLTVITYAVYCLLILADYLNLQFSQSIPTESKVTVEAMLWFYYTTALLCLVFVYDDLTQRLVKQRQQEQEKLAYIANHDGLTALANRSLFDKKLNEAIHRADRIKINVALLLIDLNKFKPINDSYGHDFGDAILRHVSQQINSTLRLDDFAARIGGDEFAVIVQGDCSERSIKCLVDRLSTNIARPVSIENQDLSVSASIGVALYPEQTHNVVHLRKAADMAMYTAKARSKSYVMFDELS